jgi:hypothetical protein
MAMVRDNIVRYADLVRDQPEDKWTYGKFCDQRTSCMCKFGYAMFVKKGASPEEFYSTGSVYSHIYMKTLEQLGLTEDEARLLIYLNDWATSAAQAQEYLDRYAAGESYESIGKNAARWQCT